MSTYLVSDIHGDIHHFKRALKMIDFNPGEDVMYVLGDVLDRGKDGIELLRYVKKGVEDGYMFMIKGNHELFAQMYLDGVLDGGTWHSWGGKDTMKDLDRMKPKEAEEIKKWIEELPHYLLLNWEGEEIVLTHSGIAEEHIVETDNKVDVIASIEKAVGENEFHYLVSNDLHYIARAILRKLDHFMIVGHVPVMRINEDGSNRIYHHERYMCIDTGAGFRSSHGKVSIYCMDTQREYYA